MRNNYKTKIKGFTLIEISIVIIIIGLIIGGVTAGGSLIETARVNATISQMQKYETMANVFRQKYHYLPGDFDEASTFIDSSLSDGNGDDLIHGGTNNDSRVYANGEPTEFWRHLSKADMIAESFTQLPPSTNTTTATVGTHYPKNKLKTGGTAVMSGAVKTIWYIGTNTHFHNGVIAPSSAYSLDKKLDDGMPGSGLVVYADWIENNKWLTTDPNFYIDYLSYLSNNCVDAYNNIGIDETDNYDLESHSPSCSLAILTGL